jgi:hypothetical protein
VQSSRWNGTAPPSLEEIERVVARIWSDVLKLPVERIAVGDHFFALGGDSNLAAQVRERIADELLIELSIGTFFDAAKMGEIAKVIQGSISEAMTA